MPQGRLCWALSAGWPRLSTHQPQLIYHRDKVNAEEKDRAPGTWQGSLPIPAGENPFCWSIDSDSRPASHPIACTHAHRTAAGK